MREPKFRAWDKENEEYRNGHDVLLKYDGSAISRYALGALDTDMPVNVVIEQCTGLKDKNGKEIYEGDIVRVGGKWRLAVVYTRAFCAFELQNTDREECMDLRHEHMKRYEVIGNIHENPELLEDGDES